MGPPDPTVLERQQALELNNLRGKFCLVEHCCVVAQRYLLSNIASYEPTFVSIRKPGMQQDVYIIRRSAEKASSLIGTAHWTSRYGLATDQTAV